MIINPYKLPTASTSRLGGIKADPKTEEDIVEVKIGEDDKLYVNVPDVEPADWDDISNKPSIYTKDETDGLLDDKADKSTTYTKTETDGFLDDKLDASLKGANSGLAELDASGKVPSSQLPSYVDDVLEYADFENLPSSGESGKIYITIDNNKTYRWTGSAYVEISSSLALGETSSTAYRGDRGKEAYDLRHEHSNKALLDTYTQTNADIALAVTNQHTHSNKTILDNTTASYTIAEQNKLNSLTNFDDSDILSALDNKVDKVVNSRLMTNAEGSKLANIQSGAEVNSVETVNEVSPDENKNIALTISDIDENLSNISALEGRGFLKKDSSDNWSLDDTTSFTVSVVIMVDEWENNSVTKEVMGITSNSGIIINPPIDPTEASIFYTAKIKGVEQGEDFITFTCANIPTDTIEIELLITSVVATNIEKDILDAPLKNMKFFAQTGQDFPNLFFGESWVGVSPKEFLQAPLAICRIAYKAHHLSYRVEFNYQNIDSGTPLLYLELEDPIHETVIHRFYLNKGEANYIDIEINDLGDFYDIDNDSPYYIKMSVNGGETYTLNGTWENNDTGDNFAFRVIRHNLQDYPFNGDLNDRMANEITDIYLTNMRLYK